jgi:arginine deiminase
VRNLEAKIKAEWDKLEDVIIHQPGLEITFGLMEPTTFLYERHFRYRKALKEYEDLVDKLEELGIKVYRLRDLIVKEALKNPEFKRELVHSAKSCLKFSGTPQQVASANERLKRSLERGLIEEEHLFDIILLNPTVRLEQPDRPPEVTCEQPLVNLVFMRDQQIVTDKGLVIGKLSKPQRTREVAITKLAFKALGITPIYEIKENGILEGGDFIPMGKFALIGLKPRTNEEGIKQLLKNDCLGFEEVAIVEQPEHPKLHELEQDPQLCMHLDTYFNVASENVVVANEELIKNATVTIFGKSKQKYEEVRKTKLYDYVTKEKGFNLCNISLLEQLCYASNFLCIKSGFILAIDVIKNVELRLSSLEYLKKQEPQKYRRIYSKAINEYEKSGRILFPHLKRLYKDYKVECEYLALPSLTGGYGGIHCMTCALKRS